MIFSPEYHSDGPIASEDEKFVIKLTPRTPILAQKDLKFVIIQYFRSFHFSPKSVGVKLGSDTSYHRMSLLHYLTMHISNLDPLRALEEVLQP